MAVITFEAPKSRTQAYLDSLLMGQQRADQERALTTQFNRQAQLEALQNGYLPITQEGQPTEGKAALQSMLGLQPMRNQGSIQQTTGGNVNIGGTVFRPPAAKPTKINTTTVDLGNEVALINQDTGQVIEKYGKQIEDKPGTISIIQRDNSGNIKVDPSGLVQIREVKLPQSTIDKEKTKQSEGKKSIFDNPNYLEGSVSLIKTKPENETTINLGEGETAFSKKTAEEQSALLAKQQTDLNEISNNLTKVYELQNIVNKGKLFTGALAEQKTALSKMYKTITGNDKSAFDEEIKNTEQFGSAIASEVANIIKAFGSGTGLSDADREFATKAAAGDITLDKESIKKLLDMNVRTYKYRINEFNNRSDKITSLYGMDFNPYKVDIPTNTYTKSRDKAVEWLNKNKIPVTEDAINLYNDWEK